jgi:outer membrane protein assembly factor BamD (BamD/ComL family)
MRIKGFILFILLCSAILAAAETWHLAGGQEWQKVGQEGSSAFLMAVAQAKQFISTGSIGKAKKAFEKLKADYPQIAGDDFDAFVKAEMLYGQRKYVKASRAYDRFTDQFPQSVFYQSVLERQYQIATAFLGGQKITALKVIRIHAYDEGGEIMNKIADKAGDAPIAQNALKTLAQSKEKRGDYEEAWRTWSDVSNRWPTGQTGQEALFGMARSLERSYNGSKFDSKGLESSKSYYAEYQKRYPEAADELEVAQKLEYIEKELAEKELIIANYYAKTNSYMAANLYYQRVLDDWPDSTSASLAEQKMTNLKEKQQQEEAKQGSSKKKKLSLKEWFL